MNLVAEAGSALPIWANGSSKNFYFERSMRLLSPHA